MALRATSGPAPSTRSAKAGERVTFTAKIENTGTAPEDVAPHVEGLRQGAMGTPYEHDFTFEPGRATIPPKGRQKVEFSWVATLPEGKDAHTFRGKVVLRRLADMKAIAEAPLDLYVAT